MYVCEGILDCGFVCGILAFGFVWGFWFLLVFKLIYILLLKIYIYISFTVHRGMESF